MSWWRKMLGGGARSSGGIAGLHSATLNAHDLEPGMVLGEAYRIQSIVGQGGFGRVFQCTNWQGRFCAVKTLRPSRLTDPDMIELMRKEIRRSVELGVHPHIVTAFGFIEHARLPCLVMEYLFHVTDLAAMIGDHNSQWRSALRIGAQIAAALDYAGRQRGLLHRDIKPANILVNSDDGAKLGDFGVSVAQRSEADGLAGWQVGTPPYMAPELWQPQPQYSAQSDIYALGVTLYEAAVRRHPLVESNRRDFDDYARLHVTVTPQSPLRFDGSMPPAFAALLLQCLAKDPAQRPRDAAELCVRLTDLCRVHDGKSPVRSSTQAAFEETDTWTNRSSMYHQFGLAKEALECARRAQAAKPDDPDALVALGNACDLAGRRDEAVTWFKRAAGMAKSHDLVPFGSLAFCLFKAGDRDGARQALEQALQRSISSDDHAQLDKISHLIVDLLEPARALTVCDKITADLPQAAITWNNRAVLLRRMGRPKEALQSTQRALELNPVYAKAWTNRANALLELEQPGAAVEAAARALELDTGLPGTYAALYAACMELGRVDDAEAALSRGLAVFPDNELLRANRDRLAAYKQDRG